MAWRMGSHKGIMPSLMRGFIRGSERLLNVIFRREMSLFNILEETLALPDLISDSRVVADYPVCFEVFIHCFIHVQRLIASVQVAVTKLSLVTAVEVLKNCF